MFDYEIAEELKKKVKKKYPELYQKIESKELQIDLASVINIHNDHYVSIIDKKKKEKIKLKFKFNKENSKITYVGLYNSSEI